MTHNLKRGSLADAAEAPAAPVRPSATLVLVRDGAAAMEVLLLRRGRQLKAFAGAWAFPGGATDPIDGPTEAGNRCRRLRVIRRFGSCGKRPV